MPSDSNMDGRVGAQLAESVLEAAGSLHQLQEELDRISLHHCSSGSSAANTPSRERTRTKSSSKRSHKTRKKKRNDQNTSFSRPDYHRELSMRRHEPDTTSLRSESNEPSSLSSSSRFDSAIGSLHSQTDNDSLSSQLFVPPTSQSHLQPSQGHKPPSLTLLTSPPTSLHSTTIIEAKVEQYTSPQLSIPTLVIAQQNTPAQQRPSELDSADSRAHQNGSSLHGNQNVVTVLGTEVQLRPKMPRPKVHNQLTAEDTKRHFKWLESAGIGVEHGTSITASGDYSELESERSSSTVVGDEMERNHDSTNISPDSSPAVPHGYLSTPQVNVPHRYQTTPSTMQDERERSRQPPRRSASILNRLKRKHGSFKRDTKPQKRTPVQRSLSDRFVYHFKKKQETHEEDVYPISTPSLLRPIGRLLRTYAGRLHVIQLHKPPDGHFGIYISQEGVDQKIFISRFATATAEKFYAGLLSPGDEIVSVNKHKVRGKSLDSVYRILSQLDSVIIAVVPVTAHRNW